MRSVVGLELVETGRKGVAGAARASMGSRGIAVAVVVCAALVACNQDAASSNQGRETHMGETRAAPPAAAESAAPAPPVAAPAAAPAVPVTGSASAPTPAPAAPAQREKP